MSRDSIFFYYTIERSVRGFMGTNSTRRFDPVSVIPASIITATELNPRQHFIQNPCEFFSSNRCLLVTAQGLLHQKSLGHQDLQTRGGCRCPYGSRHLLQYMDLIFPDIPSDFEMSAEPGCRWTVGRTGIMPWLNIRGVLLLPERERGGERSHNPF